MNVIFESKTEQPEKFELPNGENVVNFGHVVIVDGDRYGENNS